MVWEYMLQIYYSHSGSITFADIIKKHSGSGESLFVATYNVSDKQLSALMPEFKGIFMVVDAGQLSMNAGMIDRVIALSESVESNLTVRFTSNHAKVAVINNETAIFSSANLSKSNKNEIYVVAPLSIADGLTDYVDKLKTLPDTSIDLDSRSHTEFSKSIQRTPEVSDSFDIDSDFRGWL